MLNKINNSFCFRHKYVNDTFYWRIFTRNPNIRYHTYPVGVNFLMFLNIFNLAAFFSFILELLHLFRSLSNKKGKRRQWPYIFREKILSGHYSGREQVIILYWRTAIPHCQMEIWKKFRYKQRLSTLVHCIIINLPTN